MNQTALHSLHLGGAPHLGWAGFHPLFPRVFAWHKALAGLDPVNRAIVPVMNLCLVFHFRAAHPVSPPLMALFALNAGAYAYPLLHGARP